MLEDEQVQMYDGQAIFKILNFKGLILQGEKNKSSICYRWHMMYIHICTGKIILRITNILHLKNFFCEIGQWTGL